MKVESKGEMLVGYHLKDNVFPAIAEPLFDLRVGEITKPIRMTFRGKPHYAIFQVSDEMPVKRSTAESKVQEEVFGIKRAERYMLVLDSLKNGARSSNKYKYR